MSIEQIQICLSVIMFLVVFIHASLFYDRYKHLSLISVLVITATPMVIAVAIPMVTRLPKPMPILQFIITMLIVIIVTMVLNMFDKHKHP